MKTPQPNKKPRKAKPATKTLEVEQHFNDKLTMAKADKVVAGTFLGKPTDMIAASAGLSHGSATKRIHDVMVPIDYPETMEDWQAQVKQFLQIAIWKGSKRLADEGGIEVMELEKVPVSMAILTDKLAIMNGQATSVSLHLTASLNPTAVLERLKSAAVAKGDGSKPIDVEKAQ